MKIDLTKQQFEVLIRMVYLGEWMLHSTRTESADDEYEHLMQYLYTYVRKFGCAHLVEYDKELEKYFPTNDYEDCQEIRDAIDDYDDELFWEELVSRLARRDFIEDYGIEKVEKMDWVEKIYKEQPYLDKYYDEFEAHGIERLVILQGGNGNPVSD